MRSLVLILGTAAWLTTLPGVNAGAHENRDTGFHAAEAGLTPSERAGREIWFKATGGNDRFHTYTFQQRIGVIIDWFRVLRSDARSDRFAAWGLINDPGCCTPGTPGCAAESMEETYGLDWCEGDRELLKFVGKTGYRDPACDFRDAPVAADDPHGPEDQRQSACDLKFGTSAGVLGFRKFPNPKFDRGKWRGLNGKLGTWAGFTAKLHDNPMHPDAAFSRLFDASIEPPFRIGMACAACHVAFHPANPPDDPADPQWEHLLGAIGNQYARVSEVMVSGMPRASLAWQVFSQARPGTTDTSAVPTDQINNPGTQNAIVNLSGRPRYIQQVTRWRKTRHCDAGQEPDQCWCEPQRDGKCWRRDTRAERVPHMLKGGEDSIGLHGALHRVYFNLGVCAEQCWVNHLTDLRVMDPTRRNYGQTPMDLGQCRRDCASFRALEDRLPDLAAFLSSHRTNAIGLMQARERIRQRADPGAVYEFADLVEDLEHEFGANAVERGRLVFAETCARCHSSGVGPPANRDFYRLGAGGLRDDFLGDDMPIPASEVGTNHCRALHSNHMTGHVWEQFASDTYRHRPAANGVPESRGGGPGYYRNISLINLWFQAPFMHNNAVGPELCGRPRDQVNDFYESPYVGATGKTHPKPPPCWEYDPSVEGRYELYKASMEALLNPDRRIPKTARLDRDIKLPLGPSLGTNRGGKATEFTIVIPRGTPRGLLGNFQHKRFVRDLVWTKTNPGELGMRLERSLGAARGAQTVAALNAVREQVRKDPSGLPGAVAKHPHLFETYSSCTDMVENRGHRFGEDLSAADKGALTAFLATL